MQYRSNCIGNRGDNYKFGVGDGIAARKLGDAFRRAVKKDERAQAQARPDAKKPFAARQVLRKHRNQHKRRRYGAEAPCVCEPALIEGVSHTAEAAAGAFETSLHFCLLIRAIPINNAGVQINSAPNLK